MDKVDLKVGDIFSQAWKGCQEPMWFKVLNIDRATNSIEVECHSFDGLNVFPELWSLDSTEAGFEVGEYKLVNNMNKIELKVGDIFTHTKQCPIYYRILELDKLSDYAKIEFICPYDVDNWDENWTLSSIEEGFKEGIYKLVK